VKLSFKFFLLALTCFIFTTSCKKEIDYHPEWNLSSMSGKIDGVLLECTLATAQTYVVGGKTTIQISGNKGLNGFSLMIDDFKGVGTYNVADNNQGVYLTGVAGLSDSFIGLKEGTIKITSYEDQKIITGTFEFKGENPTNSATKNITEGKFTISLVPIKLPETNNSSNNLNAKVDGVAVGLKGEAVQLNLGPLGNTLTIVSVNGDKRMVFGVIGYKGVGTYKFPDDATGAYLKDQTPSGSFAAESGTLVITSEANNKLKGTFSFQAPNQDFTIKTAVSVTEGSFELPFKK
jgi:hypothetical protein